MEIRPNTSPGTQRKQIIDNAKSKDYEIVDWYEDLGISAYREDALRPEYQRMIADAKADPETTIILVAYYDRFSRSQSAPAHQADLQFVIQLQVGQKKKEIEGKILNPISLGARKLVAPGGVEGLDTWRMRFNSALGQGIIPFVALD